MNDRERLVWLLTLIWSTGRDCEESEAAAKRLGRLRRKLHNACFPFRDALDEAIREGGTR